MGREARRLEITGSVSRHNEPRDDEDDEKWFELVQFIENHISDNWNKYESIQIEIQ
jgi:hypothetical protein